MSRRIDHIMAIRGSQVQSRVEAISAYDRLLAYFDDAEPAVADVIRYGFKSHDFELHTTTCEDCCTDCLIDVCVNCGHEAGALTAWFCPLIDYPPITASSVGEPPETTSRRASAKKPQDSSSTEVPG